MKLIKKLVICIIISPLMFFFFTSCTEDKRTVTLAEQYGLAYAPVSAARLKGWFKEEVPETEFKWQTAGNAATVRESILAGKLDGGFMGIPPYLIGKDRGMKWTAAAAVARAELGLVTVQPGVDTLGDIPENMRIALPQPGSIQHILLAMAADRELGDAGIFDNRLITLSHPDGLTALMAGTEVKAHFTSPPYLQKELMIPGARLILDGNEAFGGEFTFIIAVFSDDFIKSHPEELAGVRRAIQRGADWLNENPDEAAAFLADYYRMEESELGRIFHSAALSYGGDILGMEDFQDFMLKRGYLKNGLQDEELILP
ncbi:MAG: ABC transporter substrate-binding protein [Spirochaetaceae bacterium]|nr:ABC transporter substrate-binding protein [Spirochaetaceae bacterium]